MKAGFKIGLSKEDKQNMANDVYNRADAKITPQLNAMHETIQSLGGLKPSGVDSASNILSYTENKGVYVANDTGGWYYWNGSSYVYGGSFQSDINAVDLGEIIPESTIEETMKKIHIKIEEYTGIQNSYDSQKVYMILLADTDGSYGTCFIIRDIWTGDCYITYFQQDDIKKYRTGYTSDDDRLACEEIFLSNIANGSVTTEKLSEKLQNIIYIDEYIESNETFEVLSGNYVNGVNGNLTEDNNGKYTDYIEIATSEKYIVNGSYVLNTCVIATYDKDKNFLRSYGYGSSAVTIFNEEFIPQNDEVFARFCSYNWGNVTLTIQKYIKKNVKDKIEEVNNKVEAIKSDIEVNDFYKKDISSEVVLSGGYIAHSNGNFATDNNSQYTDYIKLQDNDIYYVSGKAMYNTSLICTYDKDQKYLRYYGVNTGNTSTACISIDLEFKLKEDEKYVRFSSYQDTLIVKKLTRYTINEKFKSLEESNGNVLYGKKYVACGDSFTEGDFTGFTDENGLSGTNSPYLYDSALRMFKTYPYWIAKRNNMALINEAKSGSVFTNIKTESKPFSVSRYLEVPTDTDYITLMFGLNEFDLTTEQIGTKDDTTNTTLWGAYNIVFEHFLTNMPYAKIGVIIPDAWMNSTYSNAVKEICSYWGIPVLDLKDDTNVPMGIMGRNIATSSKARELRDSAFKVSSENNHPNIEAHKYRSTFIENFLRSL